MLTRSETSAPPPPPLADDVTPRSEGKSRRPILLAALAGLLAIAGTFLLIRYISQNNSAPATATPIAETRQVLIATGAIEAGTDVSEIIANPEQFLAARSVPAEYVASGTITSVSELDAMAGQTLGSDMIAGDHMTASRFVERATFQEDSFLERTAAVAAPEGHHTLVVSVPADRALNGNLRPGERVAVISSFRVDAVDNRPFEISVMVLPAVEVVYVESTEDPTGQLATDADSLGRSLEGDIDVTLAVEPNEVTDLVYALEYGSITLVGSIDGATNQDPRPLSTVGSVVNGSDLMIGVGEQILIEDLIPFEITDGAVGAESTGAEARSTTDSEPADDAGSNPTQSDDGS